jgi:hypothetical protein
MAVIFDRAAGPPLDARLRASRRRAKPLGFRVEKSDRSRYRLTSEGSPIARDMTIDEIESTITQLEKQYSEGCPA